VHGLAQPNGTDARAFEADRGGVHDADGLSTSGLLVSMKAVAIIATTAKMWVMRDAYSPAPRSSPRLV
jgi:hypothetical protein